MKDVCNSAPKRSPVAIYWHTTPVALAVRFRECQLDCSRRLRGIPCRPNIQLSKNETTTAAPGDPIPLQHMYEVVVNRYFFHINSMLCYV